MLGAVARRHGDFAAAEDAVQEALIAAAAQWPADGVPANPRGWLYHVALRRLTDHLRSEISRRRREDAVATEMWADWAFVPPPNAELGIEQDDTLKLIFMCCHPDLTPASAIALTLRAVGGLTTSEIARAYLVPEATMAQRISRAKSSIRDSAIAFSTPADDQLAERLVTVLHVLYLIFSEGYASSAGVDLQRTDLSNEAIRLTRLVGELLPQEREVTALLALMLLTDARRAARTGANDELIPLDEQDRSLWNRSFIAEGLELLTGSDPLDAFGPYRLQAAIAAVHDQAETVDETDWEHILALYKELAQRADNPMVTLNYAIAAAMVFGYSAGFQMLEPLDSDARIAGHYRLDAVRGHFYEMAGDVDRAVQHYHAAAEKTASMPERNYLITKAARLNSRRAADSE
ncbi:MAG: DUF6596 domain-containing protein [Gemmatimonadaceae bacterium]